MIDPIINCIDSTPIEGNSEQTICARAVFTDKPPLTYCNKLCKSRRPLFPDNPKVILQVPEKANNAIMRATAAPAGPGSAVAKLLKTFGIASCQSCVELAGEMDDKGPDWCLENLNYLEDKMIENGKKKGWAWGKAAEWTARKILLRGIELSRQAQPTPPSSPPPPIPPDKSSPV